MTFFKSIIKPILPYAMLKLWRQFQARVSEKRYRNHGIKRIFTEIYNNNRWGGKNGELYSGSGSHIDHVVEQFVRALEKFIRGLDEEVILFDCGCGDMSVGSRLIPICKEYIGGDIVDRVVKQNAERYREQEFINFEVGETNLPDCNVIVVRQVLQHLPNEPIQKFVSQLQRWHGYLIITDHQPYGDFVANVDHFGFSEIRLFSKNSGVVLDEEPFLLNYKNKEVIDVYPATDGNIVTTLYQI